RIFFSSSTTRMCRFRVECCAGLEFVGWDALEGVSAMAATAAAVLAGADEAASSINAETKKFPLPRAAPNA
ncbi:MAG TPA: hypothetical protein VFX22_06310, partial [Candidatus Kapabacteria bacterium]|nr:hypothetical protein [Candidatus Kapabacteria bacterium]